MSTQSGKDTIYIDVDDEITAIIDKVRASQERIVALVLPKRAAVLQSIVNMKLLKRTADASKKHLVLITSEAGLLPLAGSVGIYVAKTLQSKPEIPPTSGAHGQENMDDQEEAVSMADDLDNSRPLGEHLSRAPASVVRPDAVDGPDDQPIELDNSSPAGPVVGTGGVAAEKAAKKGGNGKKFKIPDFNKFRLWGIVGVIALVIFIFMWYMAFVAMPRANISIKTDSTAIEEAVDVRLNTAATEADIGDSEIPATAQQTQKTATQQADATGQKDKGQKASGTVTATTPCSSDLPHAVPAGTAVSVGNLTYITQETMGFDVNTKAPTGKCQFIGDAGVVAQQNGAQYNSGSRSDYRIAGYPNFEVSSEGMNGGTSQMVKVVSQADIDTATQKINAQNTDPIKAELQQGLTGKGLYAIDGSFSAGSPVVTASAKVGDEATGVTVTQKTTYTMFGAKEADLKKLIAKAVNKKIDPSKQQILDYGLDEAVFKLQDQRRTTTRATMDVTAITGSDLDIADIKKQVAGKKSGDAKEIIGKYPGVTDVSVDYAPFWVSSIPKKTVKITVTVEKPVIKNADH